MTSGIKLNNIKFKMRVELLFTILVLASLPIMGSYFMAHEVVVRSLNLGFSPAVPKLIERYQQHLRDLRRLKAFDEKSLQNEFAESRELQVIFQDPEAIKNALSRSLVGYFFSGLLMALILALIAAWILSWRINQRFSKTVDELLLQREKIQYLENLSQWQEVAKKLVHEIKGPLTPIELLVSGLPKSYEVKDDRAFLTELLEVKRIVGEEVETLRKMVQHFSDFAKLPSATLTPIKIVPFLEDYLAVYGEAWPELSLQLTFVGEPTVDAETDVALDLGLFRQVLTNLVKNAAEANLGKKVQVSFILSHHQDDLSLEVYNSGCIIPLEIHARIFEIYFSTKKNHENMGLGLPIVKKIIMEHGGNIECLKCKEGAAFRLKLPYFKYKTGENQRKTGEK